MTAPMDIEAALAATFQRWSTVPFGWGGDDCLLSVASYVELVTGYDAGAPWRGTYDDEASAMRVMSREGGALAALDKAMTAIGLARTSTPRRGDPVCAVVAAHEVGGIFLGDMTAFRLAGHGRVDLWARPVGAWRLC